MKKIVITGGTGFIGSHLTRSLLNESDYQVTLVTRDPRKSINSSTRIDVVSWDLKDLTEAVEGAHCVVNLAGEPILGLWTKAKRKRIIESRVVSGETILQAIETALQKPSVLIQASAVGFYGIRGNEELDEYSSRGDGFLSHVAEEWECSSQSVEKLGVRRCIIRSGIVLGHDGFIPRMIHPFRFRIRLLLGSGQQWIPWIHIHDEIRAIRFLMENHEIEGVFNLVNPNPIRYHSLVSRVASYYGPSLAVQLPIFLLQYLAGDFAREVLLADQRVLPRRLSALGFQWEYSTIEDALNNLLTT